MPLSESGSGGAEGKSGKGSKKTHKETLVVAGLPVNVFSDPESGGRAEINGSVVVMFLLHGRTGSARRMETYVTDIFEEIRARRREDAEARSEVRDLLIVTIVSSHAWLTLTRTEVEGSLPVSIPLGPKEPREARRRRAGEHGMVR